MKDFTPGTVIVKNQMRFYKLEAKYPYTTNFGKKRTKIYKYFYKSYDSALAQIKYDLSLGGRITIREISEHEYMKGIS